MMVTIEDVKDLLKYRGITLRINKVAKFGETEDHKSIWIEFKDNGEVMFVDYVKFPIDSSEFEAELLNLIGRVSRVVPNHKLKRIMNSALENFAP